MSKKRKQIKASDIENYGVNNHIFEKEYIYSQGDYDGGEEIVTGIIDLCRSDKSIDEIKKKLRYGIIGHFISIHNGFIGAEEAIEEYMKEEFEEASQEVMDRGNFGWDMCFSQLLFNLKAELKRKDNVGDIMEKQTDRKPKAGDIIHYVLLEHRPGEPYQYHEAPAIIVRVGEDKIVDICVFFGGDGLYPCNGNYQPANVYLWGVHYDENWVDGTWHWIEEFDMPPSVKHVYIDLRDKKK